MEEVLFSQSSRAAIQCSRRGSFVTEHTLPRCGCLDCVFHYKQSMSRLFVPLQIIEGQAQRGRSDGKVTWYSSGMDARDEARQRRMQWTCGVTPKGGALAAELAFWRAASSSTKFAAIRAMADESEIIKGHVPAPGLQRSIGGIRRARR